ncbi:hypothetical protein [Novosphingobium naphthalenivorans]|uniref:hypothetical protein n=1 Tax=Novosphingobium naphthalenivorans TaxID=273168 RepID=UPI00082C58E3|nr:hypothetical protein [Novosphingobium naphthalenivorans]
MAVTLRFRRLEPFGVEVSHDLSRPLAPSLAYHFGELLREHGVLAVPGQVLSEEALAALCALRPGTQARSAPHDATGTIRLTQANGDVLAWPWQAGGVIFWDGDQVQA